MHYYAAWTDSGFFLTCDDQHKTIREAVACIPCAGGYVVAVDNGAMRALTPYEEAVFQSIVHGSIPPALRAIKSPVPHPPGPVVGETLMECVLRLWSAYGFGSQEECAGKLDSNLSAEVRIIEKDARPRLTCEGDEEKTKAA